MTFFSTNLIFRALKNRCRKISLRKILAARIEKGGGTWQTCQTWQNWQTRQTLENSPLGTLLAVFESFSAWFFPSPPPLNIVLYLG